MKKTVAIVCILIVGLGSLAYAGNNPEAKAAVHVRAHNAKAGCSVAITGCADIVTTEAGFSVDAFMIHFNLVEYLGTEYAMCWPAWTYSAAFTSCSDLVIGAIANPGDGAAHTWTACQTAGVAVSCFLWLYADAPGMICPCDHPISGVNQVLDCSDGLDSPDRNFCAGVFGEAGDDPCEPTVTEPTTWGAIKSMFQ